MAPFVTEAGFFPSPSDGAPLNTVRALCQYQYPNSHEEVRVLLMESVRIDPTRPKTSGAVPSAHLTGFLRVRTPYLMRRNMTEANPAASAGAMKKPANIVARPFPLFPAPCVS